MTTPSFAIASKSRGGPAPWARMLPKLAAPWLIGYSAVHTWWAFGHAPHVARFPYREHVIGNEWTAVLAADLALVATILLAAGVVRWAPRAWAWATIGTACVAGLFLIAASGMFGAELAGLLMGGGITPSSFFGRGSGVVGGALTVLGALVGLRTLREACLRCGRPLDSDRRRGEREDPSPAWGFFGGYLAMVACVGRLVAEVVAEHGLSTQVGKVVFTVVFLLAGTLLPMALVHRFGRIWPAWVPIVSGRRIPRWLVLGPALPVAGGLVGYFGLGGVQALATDPGVGWFLYVAVSTYAAWGVGLGIAAASYYRMTRPACSHQR